MSLKPRKPVWPVHETILPVCEFCPTLLERDTQPVTLLDRMVLACAECTDRLTLRTPDETAVR